MESSQKENSLESRITGGEIGNLVDPSQVERLGYGKFNLFTYVMHIENESIDETYFDMAILKILGLPKFPELEFLSKKREELNESSVGSLGKDKNIHFFDIVNFFLTKGNLYVSNFNPAQEEWFPFLEANYHGVDSWSHSNLQTICYGDVYRQIVGGENGHL